MSTAADEPLTDEDAGVRHKERAAACVSRPDAPTRPVGKARPPTEQPPRGVSRPVETDEFVGVSLPSDLAPETLDRLKELARMIGRQLARESSS